VYEGIVLKAGTVVIANTWACCHDEEAYPDPENFDPSRFLTEDRKALRNDFVDPRTYVFGYGRRICPGRNLADAMLWTSVAIILSTFELSKGVDQQGQVIEPVPGFRSNMISRTPLPYSVVAHPRSEEALMLLLHEQASSS